MRCCMNKLRNIGILCFLILMCFQVYPANAVKEDMKKLVNYTRMSTRQQDVYTKQREAQYRSWQKNQIPQNFQIPAELQSYRSGSSTRYYALYNPGHKTGVGYVPSNLSLLYEEEAWRAFQEAGPDAPSLSIVLAQQFTESAFNPYARGDNNKSEGLPQLYSGTAKYLYQVDRATWEQIFYFDKDGRHHFRNVRAMVRFPFIFLPKVKKYSAEDKFEGIRRYNGAGESAIQYAEKVIKRSLFYEDLFAQYQGHVLDTTGFYSNLFNMINLTLVSRGETAIHPRVYENIFENMLIDFSSGYVHQTYFNLYRTNPMEGQAKNFTRPESYKMPADGKEYYLIVEDGRTLYSYFKDPEALLLTLNHAKNAPYFIYYKEKGQVVRVQDLQSVGKHAVYTNVRPGDKVFIPPGTIIQSPETNLAVRIN